MCRKWAEKLAVSSYRLYFELSDDPRTTSLSSVKIAVEHQQATVILHRHWRPTRVTVAQLDRVAFHEMMHIALEDYTSVVRFGGENLPLLRQAEHRLIVALENTLFGHESRRD